MDLARFRAMLEAYGANPERWPHDERPAAEVFAAQHASMIAPMLAEAVALDAALSETPRLQTPSYDLLAKRVLKRRPLPESLDRRALMALAACAIFGVLVGFGGALLAPAGDFDFSIAEAFGGPVAGEGG